MAPVRPKCILLLMVAVQRWQRWVRWLCFTRASRNPGSFCPEVPPFPVVPGPAVSASPQNLLEMQILMLHPRPTEPETLGARPYNLCFDEPSTFCPYLLIYVDKVNLHFQVLDHENQVILVKEVKWKSHTVHSSVHPPLARCTIKRTHLAAKQT